MKYKYRKSQIFGKRLDVPKDVLSRIYKSLLYFDEYIKYGLDDKIPISCLIEIDRDIVEKFGVEKAKTLDWELINKSLYHANINFRELLMNIDDRADLNTSLYEIALDKIRPGDYSERMKKVYQDRVFEILPDDDYDLKKQKESFNNGTISLKDLVYNWGLYKEKDLSYCLQNDQFNEFNITDKELKDFMTRFEKISKAILENSDIYQFIYEINDLKSEEEKREYIKHFTDDILEKTISRERNQEVIKLTNDEYKEVFNYSSLQDHLKKSTENNDYQIDKIFAELKSLSQNNILDVIPFDALNNSGVLYFIAEYGVKNVLDFDNECGHFFTKNNCQMLKLMFDMYLHYALNKESNKTIFTRKKYDENDNYIDRPYTKDEFYEAIKRMIIYGPTNGNYGKKGPDYRGITGEFRIKNPQLFIPEQAPEELQKAFYTKSITPQLLAKHPDYIPYLHGKNLSSCFEYRNVEVNIGNSLSLTENFYDFIGKRTNFDEMMKFITEYSDVFDIIFDRNLTSRYKHNINLSKEDNISDVERKINEYFRKLLIDRGASYPKLIPQKLAKSFPSLFLSQDVPEDIRNKFYNREFTLNDFATNPELLDIIGNTNIVCGFSKEVSWMIPLFSDNFDQKTANYSRLKIISAYLKFQDVALSDAFKEYIMEFGTQIDIDKIEYVSEVLSRLSLSNSTEIFTFRKELALQILASANPLESLNKIEEVFIKNNIPTVGKIYSCFEILHPDFQGFNFDSDRISPVLKKSSTMAKKVIVFSDLIKTFFGSNNQSINNYLKNIEIGSKLYEKIKSGQIQYEFLDEVQKQELIIFDKHLATLYNNTMKGRKENDVFTTSEDVLTDILELSKKLSPNGTLDYNLADRVIRMFCGFAGIDTLDQAKKYIIQKIKTADARNRDASKQKMTLEKGDFIKGIGDITYLRNILQNGSVSKEYLGSSAGSDATPLDTDVSMILSSDGTIEDKFSQTAAKNYGPIWFVLKNDDRFTTTRTASENFDVRDLSKMEVFYTGVLGQGHYGIRTGFASSEINYIVMDNYDPKVALEIAMNGFYIPIANKEGQIVFTPKDYDLLREKMSGLSYYNENDYQFSSNLATKEIADLASQIEQSNYEVQVKRSKINEVIKKSVEELGLHLKTKIDGDLTEGFVELIDTGSTGRGTNKPGDGDFDFMMRLDKTILSNPSRMNELKQILLKNLGKENSLEITGTGDFRLKGVQLDNDINVDIDITFTQKTDKISYSTDMALQDRLSNIKKANKEKYKYVIANILFAKQILKQAEVYKPDRGVIPQGGLGGVGIENWILQNGGSFIDAATSFIKAAEGKSFEEFKSSYQIWDFGDNHLAEKLGKYSHDNFVRNNMSEAGYQKMVQVLNEYVKNYNYTSDDEIIKK